MSDITGSSNVSGITFTYDIDPDTPSATITASYAGVKLGSATLTSQDATATIGGSVPGTGTTVKATLTADWADSKITYSVKIDTPLSKAKKYSGTLVHW
jgi:hypothetical protein